MGYSFHFTQKRYLTLSYMFWMVFGLCLSTKCQWFLPLNVKHYFQTPLNYYCLWPYWWLWVAGYIINWWLISYFSPFQYALITAVSYIIFTDSRWWISIVFCSTLARVWDDMIWSPSLYDSHYWWWTILRPTNDGSLAL